MEKAREGKAKVREKEKAKDQNSGVAGHAADRAINPNAHMAKGQKGGMSGVLLS